MTEQVRSSRDTGWFRSTFSVSGANDSCVEVRISTAAAVGVRDSKSPATGALWVRPQAWASFLDQIRRDDATS